MVAWLPFVVLDYLVAHAGKDQIVYRSALPMRDPFQQLGRKFKGTRSYKA
jgi:hypothetical protein